MKDESMTDEAMDKGSERAPFDKFDLLKPVALLVKSDTSPKLDQLDKEIENSANQLEKLGFEVQVLEGSAHHSIGDALSSKSPYFGRISIFHYAGHSTKDGLKIRDDKQAGIYSYEHLRDRLKTHNSLRLVILNSCFSDGFLKELDHSLDKATLITADTAVSDKLAGQIVASFYENFLTQEKPAQESLISAEEKVCDDIAGAHLTPEDGARMVDAPGPVGGQLAAFPWRVYGDRDTSLHACRLAVWHDYMATEKGRDSGGYFPWGALIGYALIAVICILSAYTAHHWKTSPAFQAAFSYGPNLKEALPFADAAIKYRDVTQAATITDFKDFVARTPKFGARVESFRSLMLCAFAFIIGYFLYNPFERPFQLPRPRSSRGFLKGLKIAARERPVVFIVVLLGFLIIAGKTVIYHIDEAPNTLADDDDRWKMTLTNTSTPAHFSDEPLLWKNASISSHSPYWEDYPSAPNYQRKPNPGSQAYRRLFKDPYGWYLPYSLCLFALVAYSILVAVTKGTWKSFTELSTGLKMLRTCAYGADKIIPSKRIVANLALAKAETLKEIRRLLGVVLFIVLAATYEAFLGFYTLASVAQAFVAFAMFLVLLALSLTVFTFIRYSSVYTSCEKALAHDRDELSRLKEHEPASLIKNRFNSLLWSPISALTLLILTKSPLFHP